MEKELDDNSKYVLDVNHIELKLKHSLRRLSELKKLQESAGGPSAHTYYGGWSMGYLEGKVAALEDVLGI